MDFDFSDEQKELKLVARRFLEDRCSLTVARRVLEGDEPYARDVWEGVAEMGWTAAAMPEEYGGIGYGYLELCVIAEELGRAVAPIPFSSSIYLAAEAILMAGSDAQKETHLPHLASGEKIGTMAISEGTCAPTAANIAVTFENGALNGEKLPVPDGGVADFAVVVAKSGDGISLALADLNAKGVTREALRTVDGTRSYARVTFDGAPAEALGAPGEGWDLAQRVLDRAAVLMAFEQIGGAQAAMEMARNYSVERFAFGRAIGSFQAIKHRIADMYIKTELARSNAYYAAWALAEDAPDLATAAASARVAASEAYHFASKENIQVHGGMGFTWEADCHFHYRRARSLGLALGSPAEWKDRLVTQLEAATVA